MAQNRTKYGCVDGGSEMRGGMMAWQRMQRSKTLFPPRSCVPTSTAFLSHYLPQDKATALYCASKPAMSQEDVERLYTTHLAGTERPITVESKRNGGTDKNFRRDFRWALTLQLPGYAIFFEGENAGHIIPITPDPATGLLSLFDPEQTDQLQPDGRPRRSVYVVDPRDADFTEEKLERIVNYRPGTFRYAQFFPGTTTIDREGGEADPLRHGFFIESLADAKTPKMDMVESEDKIPTPKVEPMAVPQAAVGKDGDAMGMIGEGIPQHMSRGDYYQKAINRC
jgi:hypothetical protein